MPNPVQPRFCEFLTKNNLSNVDLLLTTARMNSYVGDGALQRAREFLKEKADQVAADHVDIIGNASACDREFEVKVPMDRF